MRFVSPTTCSVPGGFARMRRVFSRRERPCGSLPVRHGRQAACRDKPGTGQPRLTGAGAGGLLQSS